MLLKEYRADAVASSPAPQCCFRSHYLHETFGRRFPRHAATTYRAPDGFVSVDPGLCGHCVHARVIESRKGSRFHRCGRSGTDPRFPRYPRLPVLSCIGHEEGPPRVRESEGAGE